MPELAYAPATGVLSTIWLLVAIPLASAVVLLVAGRLADRWGHLLGVASVGAAFVLGIVYFVQLGGLAEHARSAQLDLYPFISAGPVQVEFGLLLDPLSGVFVLLITGVGFLIHLYAVGYMAGDPGRRRFFGYFNLFVAAMLVLVLADNYVIVYFGWEGVGLASYLLIAFWYQRPSAATAGKKAFLMNRVGDAAFALAVFAMFAYIGSSNFDRVFSNVAGLSSGVVLLICLLLLLGAAGKSGQFPLQAWLPDAMEGPTPVSALIHAATMVTAGVYLIARSAPVFNASPTAQTVVAGVGALTLVIGAVIGCAKDDIKRVLAWSTVSQIGYMFLGVGLGGGAYALAIIYLLAHGFFKAGLFLGAGSVMHAMNDQVDIRRFGALAGRMRITWATFGVAWLAIIGIPPLSGFFTKDPIIEAAYNRPGWIGLVLGTAALLGSGVTAFYMTRLFVLTFHGPRRWTEGVHPHESPPVMTVPLVALAFGSVFAGYLMHTSVLTWLTPVFGGTGTAPGTGVAPVVEAAHRFPSWAVTLATVALVVLAALLAYSLFRNGTAVEPRPAGLLVTAARKNLYGDAINEILFERPGKYLTRALVFFDSKGIDALVNGLAAGVGGGSGRLRRLQTGFVRSYALSMLGGALLVAAAFLVVRLG